MHEQLSGPEIGSIKDPTTGLRIAVGERLAALSLHPDEVVRDYALRMLESAGVLADHKNNPDYQGSPADALAEVYTDGIGRDFKRGAARFLQEFGVVSNEVNMSEDDILGIVGAALKPSRVSRRILSGQVNFNAASNNEISVGLFITESLVRQRVPDANAPVREYIGIVITNRRSPKNPK